MDDVRVKEAEDAVVAALERVHQANEDYLAACRALAEAKLDRARFNPHPWMGQAVYRIMGGEHLRNRLERGIVQFKEFNTPDYGNPHIPPGSYYVLVDKKHAKWLDKSWELELL